MSWRAEVQGRIDKRLEAFDDPRGPARGVNSWRSALVSLLCRKRDVQVTDAARPNLRNLKAKRADLELKKGGRTLDREVRNAAPRGAKESAVVQSPQAGPRGSKH